MFKRAVEEQHRLLIVGGKPPGLRDTYHYLLRASWASAVVFVGILFVLINLIFGAGYWAAGGIAGAREFSDCFFFSVQTLGTIGYGAMHPTTVFANVLVTIEALVGLLMSAMITGLAFAKFARPTSRVLWSRICVLSDRDGVPTLMFRVANERMNHIVDANIRTSFLRAEVTREGDLVRKVYDLPLVRSSTPSFILSWTVMHAIVPGSPLYGMTEKELIGSHAEILLTLTGLDENLMHTIHSRVSYGPHQIVWGARFDDIIGKKTEDGRRIVDYSKFHESRSAHLTLSSHAVRTKE